MKLGWSIPTAVAGVAIAGVALAGTADAAVHYLALGGSNSTTATTTLYNSKGTPLALKAPSTSPALSVSNTRQIPNLNASLLGGVAASTFATKTYAANAAPKLVTVFAAMAKGQGTALCPTGYHPTGGGTIPDPTGATALPAVVATVPNFDSTTKVENGWFGVAAGDSTYNGQGAVWVACTNAPFKTGNPNATAATTATSRLAAQSSQLLHARAAQLWSSSH